MPYKDETKQKQAQHESYLRNKEKIGRYSAGDKLEKRLRVNALKEASPCSDCKIFYPCYVMDYDHRNPADKLIGVAGLVSRGNKWERIEAEIAKCDLVCANCHRIRTHKEQYGY